MGSLSRDGTDVVVELPARAIVGRTPLVGLRLEHSSVSREHAVIEWHRGSWRLRDLGSRNGTTINGRACTADFHELTEGDLLGFGDSKSWTLVDASPPPPAAVADDGTLRVGRGVLLLLPDESEPELSVEGGSDGWRCDDGESVREVDGTTTLEAGGRRWELMLPETVTDPTTLVVSQGPHIDELTAVFLVDPSEEHIRLRLRHDDGELALAPRAHDAMLLSLARERLRDASDRGLAPKDAGWVDSLELSERLRISPEKLNVHVFRARRALADRGIVEAGRVIERRARSRKVRFGIAAVHIERT